MTARVITFPRSRPGRPRRPGVVPASHPGVLALPSVPSPAVLPVRIDWDGARGLYVAVCSRCTDTTSHGHLGPVEDWAESHRCDPELAALLAAVTSPSSWQAAA